MIPLYVSGTKIYHFSTNFLQFEQISGLKPIDSKSDVWGLLVSAKVAETFAEVDMAPHAAYKKI
jgi:hypothetical protein